MKRKLTDAQIALALQALGAQGRRVTWRALRAQLEHEHGFAGRTDRLRSACRAANRASGSQHTDGPIDAKRALVQALEQRLSVVERERDLALQRAARAEEREVQHQDRWADEIYQLRRTVAQLQSERAQYRQLETELQQLREELHGLYARLGRDR